MIYELRTYDTLPGKLQSAVARWSAVVPIMERHGFKVVGLWTHVFGGYSNQYLCLLAWESVEARDKAFASFLADEEWKNLQRETEGDSTWYQRNVVSILRPMPASPLQ